MIQHLMYAGQKPSNCTTFYAILSWLEGPFNTHKCEESCKTAELFSLLSLLDLLRSFITLYRWLPPSSISTHICLDKDSITERFLIGAKFERYKMKVYKCGPILHFVVQVKKLHFLFLYLFC
jgi:hypothetical protein